MNTLNAISNMITIRSFLNSSIDNLNIKLSKEEVKSIRNRVQLLDKTILELSLKPDLLNLMNTSTKEMIFECKEDTEKVLQKFIDNETK
jgi:hypothetical protein